MNDDMLDRILEEMYSEPVFPSDELIKRTKISLIKPELLHHVIAASIILNLICTFSLTYIMVFDLHSILEKIILFSATSFIQNAAVLIIWLYREKLKEAFLRLDTNII